ncbi:YqaA family protein [Chloroflexota bacterium]
MEEEPQETHPNEVSPPKSLREKIISKNGLLILMIILLLVISIVIWQLEIDWKGYVKDYGYFGVFVLMLVSGMTIFFPLPSEAILAIAPNLMELSSDSEISLLGFVASIGAALGEITAYYAGRWGSIVIAQKYEASYNRVERWMKKYGGPAIFVFSFTPLPFDLVGLVAGSIRFPLWKFLFYCWVGRLARALLIVHLGKIGWEVIFG